MYWLLVERYSSRFCSSKGFLCFLWEMRFKFFLARLQNWKLHFDFLFCFTIFNGCFVALSNICENFSTMMLVSPTCSKFKRSKSWIARGFISSEICAEVKESLESVDHLNYLGRPRSSFIKLSSSFVIATSHFYRSD